VGAGIDIGVDAQRHGRLTAHARGDLRQRLEFRHALDVDLAHPALDRQRQFAPGLADARKDDALARNAGGAGTPVFPFRDHVHPRAHVTQKLEDRDVGAGLDGETDQVRRPRQSLVEKPVMAGERGGGIDVDGRARFGRDSCQRHVLGMQDTAPVVEMIHQTGRVRRNR